MNSDFFKKQAEDLVKSVNELNKQIDETTKQLEALTRQRDEHVGAFKLSNQNYQEFVKQEKEAEPKPEATQEKIN